jgi:hypothetical protein
MKNNKLLLFYEELRPNINNSRHSIMSIITKEVSDFYRYYTQNTFCASRKVFSEAKINLIIESLGLSASEFTTRLKTISNPEWKVINDKNYIVLLFIAKYFNDKNMKEQKHLVVRHLTDRLLSALIPKYFKLGCNDDIFNYTINTLTDRFLMRKYMGSLPKIAEEDTAYHIQTFSKLLESDNDVDFSRFVLYSRTRINAFLQSFAIEYYAVKDKGISIKANKQISDEEGNDISEFANDNSNLYSLRVNVNKTIALHNDKDYLLIKTKKYVGLKEGTLLSKSADDFWDKLSDSKNSDALNKLINLFFDEIGNNNLQGRLNEENIHEELIKKLNRLSSSGSNKYRDYFDFLLKNNKDFKNLSIKDQMLFRRLFTFTLYMYVKITTRN